MPSSPQKGCDECGSTRHTRAFTLLGPEPIWKNGHDEVRRVQVSKPMVSLCDDCAKELAHELDPLPTSAVIKI